MPEVFGIFDRMRADLPLNARGKQRLRYSPWFWDRSSLGPRPQASDQRAWRKTARSEPRISSYHTVTSVPSSSSTVEG